MYGCEPSGEIKRRLYEALDRLEKAGYIRRQPHPTDRRSLLVTRSSSRRPPRSTASRIFRR